jgi:hypothetical protein
MHRRTTAGSFGTAGLLALLGLVAGCEGDKKTTGPTIPPDERRFEAESFVAHEERGGARAVSIVDCSEASGHRAVEGVDAADEWIGFALELPARGTYRDLLVSAGDRDQVRSLAVEFHRAGADEPAVRDLLETPPGRGVG